MQENNINNWFVVMSFLSKKKKNYSTKPKKSKLLRLLSILKTWEKN